MDRFWFFPLQGWLQHAIGYNLVKDYQNWMQIESLAAVAQDPRRQSKAYTVLLTLAALKRLGQDIERRALYWKQSMPEGYSSYVDTTLRLLGNKFPAGLELSFIRLVVNALNTSSRYRNKATCSGINMCKWCGAFGDDRIWHVATCRFLKFAVTGRFEATWYPVKRKPSRSSCFWTCHHSRKCANGWSLPIFASRRISRLTVRVQSAKLLGMSVTPSTIIGKDCQEPRCGRRRAFLSASLLFLNAELVENT